LKNNEEEIKLKYGIDNTDVRKSFIVISNLEIISKEAEEDSCNLGSRKPDKK
jgi:hypothetical protein